MPPPTQTMNTHGFVLRIPDIDTIGSFAQCSGLEMSVDIYEYREGGNNDVVHRLPGRIQYPNLLLSRGLTQEDALQRWFAATQTKAETKEITLTLSAGSSQRIWTFADAFPVRWTGPTIDSNGASIATETLEIAHSGLKLG
jgi:phage tail-like protein